MPHPCLATVTTMDFVPGTAVLIHSFLQQHPAFNGDIVIIEQGLGNDIKYAIKNLSDKVCFQAVSKPLSDRLASLVSACPQLQSRQARFYSVEAFRLIGYEKVLFCDSDLFFVKPIDELFDTSNVLTCSGDGAFYRGNVRRKNTFAETSTTDKVQMHEILEQTFNAGMMLINHDLLGDEHYIAMLDMLTVETWQNVAANHTDQLVYNLYFDGKQTLVGAEYNFMLMHHEAIEESTGLTSRDARVLHFNGPIKPWDPAGTLRALNKYPVLSSIYRQWEQAWDECRSSF